MYMRASWATRTSRKRRSGQFSVLHVRVSFCLFISLSASVTLPCLTIKLSHKPQNRVAVLTNLKMETLTPPSPYLVLTPAFISRTYLCHPLPLNVTIKSGGPNALPISVSQPYFVQRFHYIPETFNPGRSDFRYQ
ncbi:hypothetical protein BC827DRAFT_324391 [Russula dissimulans]|nr:hypothetical protein BC827DRAFT_324391 [Russula dissimulans]